MMMNMQEELLNRRRAAQVLGISLSTFDRKRAAGDIPTIHPSEGRVAFSWLALQAYLKAHTDEQKKSDHPASGNDRSGG